MKVRKPNAYICVGLRTYLYRATLISAMAFSLICIGRCTYV